LLRVGSKRQRAHQSQRQARNYQFFHEKWLFGVVLKSHNSSLKAIGLPPDLDTRMEQLRGWLGARLGTDAFELKPASADASFRRYFRVSLGDARSWIAMDAPPEREDCRPFVQVAALMRSAGVNAPQVLAQDLARGFLLLTDLGETTYLAALSDANADRLFGDAIEALINWQLASREGVLPPYDEALLRRECDLFSEWYVARHLALQLSSAQRQALSDAVTSVISRSLAQAAVFVHRDYMPRNLMVSDPNPGVIDFQDAVHGPVTYDLVSLTRDAFVSWEEERVIDWAARYWDKARQRRLPVNADFSEFYRGFEWMGLQRHLKVLGIFARIHYRDGKSGYLQDTPRFIRYARAVAGRYRELVPLARLLDQLEQREPATTGDGK
jgi:aminoglycoside/choline kinase family phosphotransferase